MRINRKHEDFQMGLWRRGGVDGRVVRLQNLRVVGTKLSGTLGAPAALTTRGNKASKANAAKINEAVVPLSWDGGNYNVSGTFTEPLNIDLSGEVRQNGVSVPFVYKGVLPTATRPGMFSLTAGGQTVSVAIPAFNPTPTAKPAPAPGVVLHLQIQNGPDSNFGCDALQLLGTVNSDNPASNVFSVSFTGFYSKTPNDLDSFRSASINLTSRAAFKVGDIIPVSGNFDDNYPKGYMSIDAIYNNGVKTDFWSAQDDVRSFEVTAVTSDSITIKLSGLQLKPYNAEFAKGTLDINGTLIATRFG